MGVALPTTELLATARTSPDPGQYSNTEVTQKSFADWDPH